METAFDRETSTLILPGRSAKTKKPRKLSLEGIYREMIARRLSTRRLDCPLIFHRQGQPMGAFRKAWANACKKVGVPGLLFHDLRRTAVRNMIRAGIDKTVAKKISGHRTDAVFDRYNITSDEDIRDAMQKNEVYVSALPAKSNITPLEQVG
jgi:integrase